jgi:hypothetical protein
VDESAAEHALARVRAVHDEAVMVRSQWATLPVTPGWHGPTHMAAQTQIQWGEERSLKIVGHLADAQEQCERELYRRRAIAEVSQGAFW